MKAPRKMRGTVHIVGRAECLDRTFECNPPLENPPKETYYRRAVYQLALERLRSIEETIKDFQRDSHTGKVYRNEQGEAIGRGKGLMPSLAKQFPEVRYWTSGPDALRRTIRQASTPAYFMLLQAAVNQVEGTSGEQLELFVKTADKQTLAEIPPVLYPAHKGTKKCKTCRHPHSSALHRFHLAGSFDRTHPGPARAAVRRKQRERDRDRFRDEVPF